MAKFFSGVVLHLLASMTPGLSPEGVRLGSTSQQKLVEDVNKACKKARDVRDLQVVFNQHLTAARLRAAYGTAIEIQVVPETSLLLRRHHLFESYFPENSRKDNTMADRREDFKGALGSSQYVHSFIQDSLGSSHFLQVQARTEARNVFFSLSLLWPSLHTSQRTNPEERQYRPLVRKRDGRFQFGMLGEVHSTKASHEPRTTAQVASETEPARQQEASDTEMEPRDATEGEAPFRRLASPTHEQYLAAEAQAGNSRQEPQAQASSLQNAPETVHRAGGRRKGQKKKRKRK